MFYNESCIDDWNFVPATWPCVGWIIFADLGNPSFGEYYAEWYEYGSWVKWQSNLMFFQLDEWSDYWFYSGSEKQGFCVDTWGDGHAFPGDCYYLKKVKCQDLIFVLGKDMESLKENAKTNNRVMKDRSNETLKGIKSEYCERIRQDKDFQAGRFSFGDVEEETEE